jgi:Fe2+ transport system protein FeoA
MGVRILKDKIMILSETSEQGIYKIIAINLKHSLTLKLLSLGINELTQILVLRNNKGDVVIGLNHARIALDKNISQYIEVK